MAISAKELGELVIKIRADTTDAEAAMKRIDFAISRTSAGGKGSLYELEKASSKVGVGFTSLGRLATRVGSAILMNVTTPLIGAGTAAAKTAIDFLELKEKTKVSFETLLGSADKAKKLMGEIYEFSKTTPFSQETFYTAAQQLLAMGFTAKETKTNLEAFTNAAIATGKGADGIDTLTRSFGKMQAAGKVTLENLNMVTEMGVPAIKILANQYGVTTEELYKMISAGDVLSEDALPKLLDGMQNGTKGVNGMTAAYGELAEKMKTGTITGALDSLHSAWRNFALAVFDADTDAKQEDKVKRIVALLNEAKRVLNNLSKVFGSVTDGTNGFLDSITALTKKFADFLENTPEEELRKIGDTLIAIAKAGPMFLVLGGALKVVGSAFRGVSGMAKIIDETKKFKELGGVVGMIKTITSGIGSFGKNVATTAATVGSKIPFIGTAFSTALGPVSGLLGAASAAFGPLVVAIVAVISVVTWLKRNWDLVTEAMSEFAKKINLEEKFKSIEDAFSKLAQALGGEGGSIFQSLGGIFEALGGVIMALLIPAFTLLAGIFDGIVSAITGVVEVITGIVEVIRGIIAVISGLVTGDFSKVKQGFEEIGTGIGDVFKGLGDTVLGALGGLIEGVGEFVIELIEQFTGMDLSEVENFGRNIGEGIQQGWDNLCASAGEWAQGLWDGLVGGIKSLFGIASPAKNMEPYGKYMGEGVQNGWDSIVNTAGEWAQGLWDGICGGFQALGDGVAKVGSDLAQGVKGGVESGKEWLKNAGQTLGQKVNSGAEGVKEKAESVGNALGSAVGNGVVATRNALNTAGNAIANAAKNGAGATEGAFTQVGSSLGNATKGGVSGTQGAMRTAGNAIANAAKNAVSAVVSTMRSLGTKFGLNLKGGVSSGQGGMRSAGSALAGAAKTAITNVFSNAYTWGSHLVSNLARGISGGVKTVASAAKSVADTIKEKLGHTVPEDGPLKDEMSWMPHMIDNLSSTLTKSSPQLMAAAAGVASDMRDVMSFDDFSATGAVTKNLNVSAGSNLAGIMSQMVSLMQVLASKPDPDYQIVMDGKVVAGRLTNRIDRNMGKSNNRRSKGL